MGQNESEADARIIIDDLLRKAGWDPITIQFARSVGHILTELPKGTEPQTKYKFYM